MKKVADRTLRANRQNGSANIRTVNVNGTNTARRNMNKESNTNSALNNSIHRGKPISSSSNLSFSNNDLSSSISSQPLYYPKYPQSLSESSRDPLHQTMSPMAPLQPPWRSHLPPIQHQTSEIEK